jgi:hypothetical protein
MERPNRRLDSGLRLGCGALAGFPVGILLALGSGAEKLAVLLAGVGVAALFAIATWRFGQRFLDRLPKWLDWLSW